MADKRLRRRLFRILLIIFLGLVATVGYYLVFPSLSALKKENPGKTSFMEYREKEWEHKGKKIKIQQTWVPLQRISPYLIRAVLIAEDDKFWKHEGFDIEAIQKAIEKDIKEKKLKFGGSTITQQLAKNLYLTPEKNPLRKIKEAILTWRIERTLTKKRILEIYLNVAEWGEGIFGIEAASHHYYGKSASALTPHEAARLATVLPNPRKYSPTGTSRYVENRSSVIYRIMVRRGIVTEDYEEITDTDRAEEKQETKGILTPHGMEGSTIEQAIEKVSPPAADDRPR